MTRVPKLYPTAKRTIVYGSGPIPCNLMLIGEAPGEKEDEKGVPFIWRSGKLMRSLIYSHLRIKEDMYYVTNAVKSRPPDNRTPTLDEILSHRPYLVKEIAYVKPKVIICFGKTAFVSVLGCDRSESIGELRRKSSLLTFGESKVCVYVTYHPSYACRNKHGRNAIIEDLITIQKGEYYNVIKSRPKKCSQYFFNFDMFTNLLHNSICIRKS